LIFYDSIDRGRDVCACACGAYLLSLGGTGEREHGGLVGILEFLVGVHITTDDVVRVCVHVAFRL